MVYGFLLGSPFLGQIFWFPTLLMTGGIGICFGLCSLFVIFLMVNE